MKNLILILIALVSFQSCLTVGKIKRNCDKFYDICVTTEKDVIYRDTTIYRTDTVYFKLPADTVTIHDTIINGNMPRVYREFGLVWASASVDNYLLSVHAGLIDSTIMQSSIDTIRLPGVIKYETTTNTVDIPYLPWWSKILSAIGAIALVAFITYIASRRFF